MTTIKYDNLDVNILANRRALGEKAAADVSERITQLLTVKDNINIIFAAAPSQNEFLENLRNDQSIPWERINAFHMDEYLGLAENAKQAFGNFLKDALFDRVAFRNVYYINGNTANINEECLRYGQLITDNPPDIVCMGIGENTHIAFNEPGQADFNDIDIVKPVTLDAVCRQQQVNDGCFALLDEVPTQALTLTVPALFNGAYIFCMVPGTKKADAVLKTLTMPVTEQYPSTILRTHANAILYLDVQSAALLQR